MQIRRRSCNSKHSPRIATRSAQVFNSKEKWDRKIVSNEKKVQTDNEKKKAVTVRRKSVVETKQNCCKAVKKTPKKVQNTAVSDKQNVVKRNNTDTEDPENSLQNVSKEFRISKLYEFNSTEEEDDDIQLHFDSFSIPKLNQVFTPSAFKKEEFVTNKFYGQKNIDKIKNCRVPIGDITNSLSSKSNAIITNSEKKKITSYLKRKRPAEKIEPNMNRDDILFSDLDFSLKKENKKVKRETSTPKLKLNQKTKNLMINGKQKTLPFWKSFRLNKDNAKKMGKKSITEENLNLSINTDIEKQQFKETARSILASLNENKNLSDSEESDTHDNIHSDSNEHQILMTNECELNDIVEDSGVFDAPATPIRISNINDDLNESFSTPSIILTKKNISLDYGYGSFLDTPAISPVKTIFPSTPIISNDIFKGPDFAMMDSPLIDRSYSKITMNGLDFQEKQKRKKKHGRYSSIKLDNWAEEMNAELDDAADFELNVE